MARARVRSASRSRAPTTSPSRNRRLDDSFDNAR
jgi:hypothetical protein